MIPSPPRSARKSTPQMRNFVLTVALLGVVVPCGVHAEDDAFASRKISSKRQASLLSALFPGLGQLSTGQKISGTILVVSEIGALATALTANENYKTRLDNFDRLKSEYQVMAAGNSQHDLATERWQELNREADDLDSMHLTRRAFAAAAVGVYVYSLVDMLLADPTEPAAGPGWSLGAVPGVRDVPARLMIAGRF